MHCGGAVSSQGSKFRGDNLNNIDFQCGKLPGFQTSNPILYSLLHVAL